MRQEKKKRVTMFFLTDTLLVIASIESLKIIYIVAIINIKIYFSLEE